LHLEVDWRRVDLWLNAAIEHSSDSYVPALCSLLSRRDRYIQHEWIAELLGDIGSADAIAALRDACDVDESFDPSQSLAFRCIDALHQIDTSDSCAVIESLADSPLEHVRDYARRTINDDW